MADAIQQKLDRLDEASLFPRSIDIETYYRPTERLREELTLARIAKHSTELEELDVEGILAFAERVLPRAASGCTRSTTSGSGSNSCSFLKDWRSTASGLLEPPQPHRPSATCGEFRPAMKEWWTRPSGVGTHCSAGCGSSTASGLPLSFSTAGASRAEWAIRLDMRQVSHNDCDTCRMATPTSARVTRREREILNVVFALGNRASADEIRQRLADPPSDSSVRVMLARLEQKGLLRHAVDGVRFVYSATRSPAAAGRSALNELVQTFYNGSTVQLMTALVRRVPGTATSWTLWKQRSRRRGRRGVPARRRSPENTMLEATVGLSVLKVTLAAALGLLAARVSNRGAASVRHAILAMTFAAFAAIPTVAAIAPRYVVTLAYDSWLGLDPSFGGAPRLGETAEPAVPAASSSGPNWSTLLVAIWALGTTLCLLPPLGALLQIRCLRRGGRAAPETASMARACSSGFRRRLRVLYHSGVSGPMTCGGFRPIILLPEDATNWSREDLDRALTHEVAHVARADVLVHALARCLCAVYWFHPLVWICWRRLRQEAERACDDVVVETLGAPAAYAQQLLELARRQQFQPLSPLTTTMARRGELAARIHAILDGDQPRQRLGRRRALVFAGLVIAGVAGVAPLMPTRVAARPASSLSFVSASVLRSPANRSLSMESRADGRVLITGASLNRLLRLAYGVQDHAIVGVPAWAHSDRFDVTAMAAAGSTPGDVLAMLRTLLAEQFDLRAEHLVQERLVFVLKRRETSHGQLRPSRGCDPPTVSATSARHQAEAYGPARQPCGFRVGPGRLEGTAVSLDALAATLSTPLGRAVVVDGAGFERFDVRVSWDAGAADPVAGLIEALDHQLGLSIVGERRGLPVLVIHSARPPA